MFFVNFAQVVQCEFDHPRPREVCFVLPTYYLRGNLTLMNLFDISNFRGFQFVNPVLLPASSLRSSSKWVTGKRSSGL